ncbi:glycosyltransferase family 2 protein [Butyrivibrio sp.]|jgi:glycosyltransferase involved in cell wall biosynthesis|uniref:glycosyltransferase family 2 protein n=1 Tax=Butyrivibrio sp. TaxID=28121 RepID=UPI0025B94019|nr:glycosyltransferase family 2 protein [Butyrivibrio sp.]MBE5837320.1 glycosyltransferase family 2 protein [Butyrivibrio sp.]
MVNTLVSIIMTVYNREKYVRRGLDSIVAQKNVNIELIIVDDGSTDGSPAILDDYARRYDFIRVIHKSNGGLCSARNVGLDNAIGDYIFFIDDDDFLSENAIHDLLKISLNNDADLVIGNYARFNDGCEYDGVFEIPPKYCNKLLTKREACELFLFSENSHVLVASWGKLYKKKVWEGVRFPENIPQSEDQFIFPRVIENCNSIYFTDEIVYNQLLSEASMTRRRFDRKRLFHTEGMAVIIRYLIEMGFYDIALYKFGLGTRSIMCYQDIFHDDESIQETSRLISIYKAIAGELVKHVDLKNKLRMILFISNYGLYKKLQRMHAKNT